VDPLSSVEAALSVLSSARGTTAGLASSRKQRRVREQQSYDRFARVTSQAIVSAEYFALLASVGRTSQRQMIGTVGITAAVDCLAPGEPIVKALQPMVRLGFAYCLASELMTLHAARVDMRALFAVLEEMVDASNDVTDVAPEQVRQEAGQVVAAIAELFRQLPSLDHPFRRAVPGRRRQQEEDAYKIALADAWRQHGAFRSARAPEPRVGVRLRRTLAGLIQLGAET
jgi:hypothetical protein